MHGRRQSTRARAGGGRLGLRLSALLLAGAAALLSSAPSAAADAQPFGTLTCTPREGVRFCEGSVATRVKTFDGVPLDVNVTLPDEGESDLPLVVLLHGWGGEKVGFDESRPWAERGYAVLTYTARGFGDSCGSPSSRAADPQGCAKGWIHLADVRYEVHDTQHLAGLLADQGIADPQAIGVSGVSYGGGQTLALATLGDRMMTTDGQLVPWQSPGGLPMRIAAAAPIVPWSDMIHALIPNGGTLDFELTSRTDDLEPVGVKKESYVDGLFASGETNGYIAPPGVDPAADLTTWFTRLSAGEPYGGDPLVSSALDEITTYHSPYYLYLDHPQRPAPLLISNGFTDDLFPVNEALRYANRVAADDPGATIAQLHFDYGHPRGQNKPADIERLRNAVDDFFDRYVKGEAAATPLTGVEVLTQTCPSSQPSGGPYRAPTWSELSAGEVRFSSARSQSVTSAGGDPNVARAIDPVAGGGACATTPSADETGTANYRLPSAKKGGYTLIGSPTVQADLDVTGPAAAENSQVAARLWDVAPNGSQTLVARGTYRPSGDGQVVFQLNANAWRFEDGHVPKLQLLGRDAPFYRPSTPLPFSIGVSDLRLTLPTHEGAGAAGGAVKKPRTG